MILASKYRVNSNTVCQSNVFCQSICQASLENYSKKITQPKDVDDGVAKIKEAVGGEVDVSFDCVGSSESMSTGLIATRPGGKVCLFGMAHGMMNVPLPVAAAREVDVVGVSRYKNTWPVCLDFLRTGKIDVKPLLAHFGVCGDYEKRKKE